MKCPFCRKNETEVFNSRSTKFRTQVWRRRRCQDCEKSFTTYESIELKFLLVTKRLQKSEKYSRAKLYASINNALGSTSDRKVTADALTDTIESKLLDLMKPNLTSREIARTTLITLNHFNTPAFLRYLSFQSDLTNDASIRKELKKY